MDFDAMAQAASNAQNNLGERAFIEAASTLDAWYCVGVAPSEAPDEPEPLIAAIGNEPHVLVFTDEHRAASFAERRAKDREGAAPVVLEMSPAEARDYFAMLVEHNVTGVHFNDGDNAVSSRIRNVLSWMSG